MSIEGFSQERFILSCIEEQVQFLAEQEGEPYSWELEFGIAELVRLQMRQLAQMKWERELVILEESIQQAQEKLNERCNWWNLTYDFSSYFRGIRKELRFAAKEVSELSKQLELSRQSNRVISGERITRGVAFPLDIMQVGLQNAIESLLIVPLAHEFVLNLEGVREIYPVVGQWFPYQILAEPFDLLLDDDGTVSVTTAGLTETSIAQARDTVLTLAALLYQPLFSD